MQRSFTYRANGVTLDRFGVVREPTRDPAAREPGFDDAFDASTLFFDNAIRTAAGRAVLLGPPLNNLEEAISEMQVTGLFRQIKNALRAVTVEVMIKTRIGGAEVAELIPAQGMRAAAKVDTPEFIAAGNGIPLRRHPGQVPRIGGARDFRYYQSGRTLSTVSTARSAFSQSSGV